MRWRGGPAPCSLPPGPPALPYPTLRFSRPLGESNQLASTANGFPRNVGDLASPTQGRDPELPSGTEGD